LGGRGQSRGSKKKPLRWEKRTLLSFLARRKKKKGEIIFCWGRGEKEKAGIASRKKREEKTRGWSRWVTGTRKKVGLVQILGLMIKRLGEEGGGRQGGLVTLGVGKKNAFVSTAKKKRSCIPNLQQGKKIKGRGGRKGLSKKKKKGGKKKEREERKKMQGQTLYEGAPVFLWLELEKGGRWRGGESWAAKKIKKKKGGGEKQRDQPKGRAFLGGKKKES